MQLLWIVLSLALLTADGQSFCPFKECDCYYSGTRFVIDCRARGLSALPVVVSSNATLDPYTFNTLLLSNNNISEIPAGALPANLYSIISTNTPISLIDDGAFTDSSDTLTFLDITGSSLTELPDAFMGLHNLTSLSWAGNPTLVWNTTILSHLGHTLNFLNLFNSNLTQVPRWLKFFPFLQHLDLGKNNLSNITGITNMTTLQMLDISHNNISQLDFATLPPSLQTLSLRDNNLSSVSADVRNLVNLVNLDLSLNHIQSLDTLTFPSQLSELYVSGNEIDYLYSLAFTHNSSSLHTLYLNDNPLKIIHTDAFAQVSNLDRLVASKTLLSRLPIALTDLGQLAVLEMNTIPTLSCTCAEKPLATWFNTTSVSIFGQCHVGDISYFLGTLAPTCP